MRTQGFDPTRPPAWSKIRFVKELLHQHEWVFWTDVDSVILWAEVRLETFLDAHHDLIITWEDCPQSDRPINSGQFFLRRSDWSLAFLDEVYAQTQFLPHPF